MSEATALPTVPQPLPDSVTVYVIYYDQLWMGSKFKQGLSLALFIYFRSFHIAIQI